MIDLDKVSDEYLRGVNECAAFIEEVFQTASRKAHVFDIEPIVSNLASGVSEVRLKRFKRLFDLDDVEYELDRVFVAPGEAPTPALRPQMLDLPRTPSDEEWDIVWHEVDELNSRIEKLFAAPASPLSAAPAARPLALDRD